jgi:hypothetical protein
MSYRLIMQYFFEHKDETIDQIVKAAFPDYNGRAIKLSTDIPDRLDSYWSSGGSRNYYAFYAMDGGKVLAVQSNHPFFEPGRPSYLGGILPAGILLVEHKIFSGHDMGITIYVSQQDLAPLLPPPADYELTPEETTVLTYTSSHIPEARYPEAQRKTGITRQEWDAAKLALAQKKLLTKSGAINAKGKNYLSQKGL